LKVILLSIIVVGIIGLMIPSAFAQDEYTIPAWIKNNAGWWAANEIPDSAFVQSIQFLIKEGIMIIPSTESPTTESPTTTTESITEDEADYTVLIYMVGSDLESDYYAATNDLHEMLEIDLPSSVNVLVETGGANAKPDEYRFLDFTTVQRLDIDGWDDTMMYEIGQRNMGDPTTLSDFLIWGTQEYPAKKYALILWNHGGGITGFGWDEVYNDDETTLDEFAQALDSAYRETGIIFEVIGFDQCLMATIEVADVIDSYANYMVASEEIEPGHGWDYSAILSSLKNNPHQDGKSLGKTIADSFVQHTKAFDNYYGTNEARIITLSVVDLAKIYSLSNAITELQNKINEYTILNDENFSAFGQTLLNSERYGQQGLLSDSGHTDIKDFVTNIGYYLPQAKSEADNVKELVSDAVVYNIHGQSKPNANGLSIHIPLTNDLRYSDSIYDLSTESTMQELSDDYQNYLDADNDFPILEYEVIDGRIHGKFTGNDIYSFSMYYTARDNVVLEGATEILAVDDYDLASFPDGNFVLEWDGYLPALCDEYFCTPTYSEYHYNDNISLEYIPVFIESSGVEHEVDLVYEHTSNQILFLGAIPYSEDESIIQRDIRPLYLGDKIYTYTPDYNFNTGESQYAYNPDPVIVDEFLLNSPTTGLFLETFQGTFELIVEVCDFSNNCVVTEPIGPYIPLEPLEN